MTGKKIIGKPGRPTVDGATNTRSVSVALTAQQRSWLRASGGSVWVRQAIDRAMRREARQGRPDATA